MAGFDPSAMHVMHDALRRELAHLVRATVRIGDDPWTERRAAAGWRLFKESLRIHHHAEDEALWPPLRRTLVGWPDGLALLEAMEAEHAAIDELITAIDDRLAGPGTDATAVCLGALADALETGLTAHLRHEERQALPLVRAVVTPEQWAHFVGVAFDVQRRSVHEVSDQLSDRAPDSAPDP